ncbi:MAG: SH3 domain-containing protein [Chloroflexi bacterium]|nr:SH3 domain-containing protein [Chloroflexota bacterium]
MQSSRRPHFARFSPILILLTLLWLLAACGPSNAGAGTSDLTRAVQRIALDYQSSNDLAAARSALESLNAPNPNQLLVLVAESAISAGDFANADALVRLALALGLSSNSIARHAQSRGLISQQVQATVQSAAQDVAQTQSTATPLPAEPTPAPEAATATPEPAPEAATATPEPPTATPVADPQVRTQSAMNVRGGPGTNYPVVGALNPGVAARITGKNPSSDWWQIALAGGTLGWVYGPLVETSGDTGGVAVAEIPAPPAATATPVAAAPTNTPVPAPAGVDFRLESQRLWDVVENGGYLSGESVNCGEKQELNVIVLDVAGNRLDGVTVRGVYRNEFHVTGEKGPGLAQYDINVDGDDIVVAKDTDGREVSSDVAKGLTAKPWTIPHNYLIQGRFCKDTASCDAFIKANGCYGHFSWTVTFQRTY